MKQTFGRGLESLIPKKDEDQKPSEMKQEPIFYIDIEKIKSNPYQPRRSFSQDGLKSLAESIKEYGILQPLLVSRLQKESGITEYQLVAGERRLLAAKMSGLTQVPVIIRDPTEQEKLVVALIENVQREDLNSLEKARAFKLLQDEFKFLQKDIAHLVGKSRESIANTMRLLELPLDIKEGIREERISEGHARAILALQDQKKQKTLFASIIRNGLSVREAESLAQKLNIWQPVKRQVTAAYKEIEDLEEKIREILGIKNLKLRIESGLPKLTIFFNSKKELDALLKKIKLF